MTPFSNSRTKRRTAFVVMVVWLFALGAGWANACMLQERVTHLDHASGPAAGTGAVAILSAGHVGVIPDHDGGAASGKATCVKVCDDGSQGLVKWQSNIDQHDVTMMAPPVAIGWTATGGDVMAIRRVRLWQAAVPVPPARILFSRLAL